ncbi:hypothetical protein ALI22I_20320 [Saccharothrix sp. ALI-22-I]|uniref:hypothetical protein n=1 Tax=Saccharothrix sp. ALI-22-I TaxID=1933778 RepID=UPI00097C8352|nr:hypothetical protein [Saccharothrix sp. ALI-22-I]ONI88086.1 hypothetical protein ALI22I_20320 [Saccharothrix sp. ALI-22-I]
MTTDNTRTPRSTANPDPGSEDTEARKPTGTARPTIPDIPVLTLTELAARFDVTKAAVCMWRTRFGPTSPAPFPAPDEPGRRPKWHAERWPEFEQWNELRRNIPRKGKPKPATQPPPHDVPVPAFVIDALRAVVAYNWATEQADFDQQDDDGRRLHIFNDLTVLHDFLDTVTGTGGAEHEQAHGPQQDAPDESEMLTIGQLAAELGVTKASVHGWYVSTTLPRRFPKPVVDPSPVEGRRRAPRRWARSQLPAARAWLAWYRHYKFSPKTDPHETGALTAMPTAPESLTEMPRVAEFLKSSTSGPRAGTRRGHIANAAVRKFVT